MVTSGLCDRPFSLLQMLHLLRQVSLLREEAQELEVEGLQKVELAVAGLEAEWFVWGPEGSFITFLHVLYPIPT